MKGKKKDVTSGGSAVVRLDLWLVRHGQVATRSRAARLIQEGKVRVNGAVVKRPAQHVGPSCQVEVQDYPYVSRGGLKLEAALEYFRPPVAGAKCLDVGASTGGFTDCLLRHGAAQVTALDVGHDQLDPKLRADARVRVLEGTNARELTQPPIGAPFDVMVVDVSFISLTLLWPVVEGWVRPGGWVILLIKPQFECGPGGTVHGLVRDESLREKAVSKVAASVTQEGRWSLLGILPCPILGGDGNQEFLLCAIKSET